MQEFGSLVSQEEGSAPESARRAFGSPSSFQEGDNHRAFVSHASWQKAQPVESRAGPAVQEPGPQPFANISQETAGAVGGNERIRCGWSSCMHGPAPGYLCQPCEVIRCKKCGLDFHQVCHDIHRVRGLPSFAGNPRCPRPLDVKKKKRRKTPLAMEQESEPQNGTASTQATLSEQQAKPRKKTWKRLAKSGTTLSEKRKVIDMIECY